MMNTKKFGAYTLNPHTRRRKGKKIPHGGGLQPNVDSLVQVPMSSPTGHGRGRPVHLRGYGKD